MVSKKRLMGVLQKDISNFTENDLAKERIKNKTHPVLGEGSFDSKIIFIGEAPGKNEAKTGKPFCGASGRVLNDLLESIKIKREDVYITNIVKDRPTKNRDPKPEEIEKYSPFLDREIEIIKPKVIATLGRFSMTYIMNKFGLEKELKVISKIHGKKFEVKQKLGKNLFFVPLYHPAVAIYNRKKINILKKDFKIIKKLI